MITLNIRVPGIPRKYQKSTLGYSWELENLENRHPLIDGNGKHFSVLLIDLAIIASPGHDRYCNAFKFRIYNAKVNVTLKIPAALNLCHRRHLLTITTVSMNLYTVLLYSFGEETLIAIMPRELSQLQLYRRHRQLKVGWHSCGRVIVLFMLRGKISVPVEFTCATIPLTCRDLV